MTDAIQTENARIVRHAASVRDRLIDNGPFLFGHIAEVPGWHPVARRMNDFLLVCQAYVRGFNEDIAAIDPNAVAIELAPPSPPPPPPGTPGTMLMGDELEALRTRRLGEVIAHAKSLADARFTPDEQARWNLLHQLAQAAETDAGPPLTDEQTAEMSALDADHIWAVTAKAEAWERVDTLQSADAETLANYDATAGWPP